MRELDITGIVFDWELIKGMIYPVLLSEEKACEGTAGYRRVHRAWLDLAVCYIVRHPEEKNPEMCLNVRENLLPFWQVDEEMIYRQAMENLRQEEYQVKGIRQVILELAEEVAEEEWEQEEADFEEEFMWVLSNRNCCYGAVGILDQENLKRASARLGKKNLYILPANCHEVILLPKEKELRPEKLSEIICEINSDCVNEEERLAGHSYYYNQETGEISY